MLKAVNVIYNKINIEIFLWCDTGPLYIRNVGDNFRSIILNIMCLFKQTLSVEEGRKYATGIINE